jgi:hypothetical protein
MMIVLAALLLVAVGVPMLVRANYRRQRWCPQCLDYSRTKYKEYYADLEPWPKITFWVCEECSPDLYRQRIGPTWRDLAG